MRLKEKLLPARDGAAAGYRAADGWESMRIERRGWIVRLPASRPGCQFVALGCR